MNLTERIAERGNVSQALDYDDMIDEFKVKVSVPKAMLLAYCIIDNYEAKGHWHRCANHLQRTWREIADDVATTGGKLTHQQAAEVCADHVRPASSYKEIMALSEYEFQRVAKIARLSL